MITIYKTKTCAYCPMVIRLCERYGKKYDVVPLDDNPKLRQQLMDKTGAMTVPITTDGETYVVGWNVAKLKELIRHE